MSTHVLPPLLLLPSLLLPLIVMACVVLAPFPAWCGGLELLFLGDQGHHQPALRFRELQPALKARGIDLTYTEDLRNLQLSTLRKYAGLLVYANIDEIAAPQADAILAYVEQGGGFVPLHCASYCFRNDPRLVALMGAQFLRHGGETFSTVLAEPRHPMVEGFDGFTSWDETYVHHQHNPQDRVVLEYREQGMQADGQAREPWTWIRTHGRGRVFYTAWGHDARTWTHAGFHNLVERGIRWACRDESPIPAYRDPQRFPVPAMKSLPHDLKPFDYVDVGAKIPNYPPSNQWGTQADPLTRMQVPLPPAESLQHVVTPEGFRVELYAAEPDLGPKPIAMNWDERGRLWVCETVDYPNDLQPKNQGHDRIRICEDSNGDGRADRFTIFADGLSIPTAVVVSRGAAIVQNGTETWWLQDTDGDDVADQRRLLISGWNMKDTHGGVSHFTYGLDNWIYAMQGYNDSHPVLEPSQTPQIGFKMGFWRFRLSNHPTAPVVEELEFLRSTNNNTWGLGISEEGLIFGSTANHNPSDFMPIPNRYYERVRGWTAPQLSGIADTHRFKPMTTRIRQVDQHGGYTAGCGHALYTSRAYPRSWWNRTSFVCGPTGKLVGTFVLTAQGAGFRSTSPFNLWMSDDEWTAPIAAEVGPDGQVWVLDWYNFIVQHNPTPQGFRNGPGNAYESDLRDRRHGRIYRVVAESPEPAYRERLAVPALQLTDVPGCLAALQHPTQLVRLHAQRMLVERGQLDIVPELCALVRDQACDEIGLNVGAIHALGTLRGLRAMDGGETSALAVVWEALDHPSAGVRRNAIQSLPMDATLAGRLAQHAVARDDDAQVRLAWLLALADRPAVLEGTDQAEANRVAAQLALCLSDPRYINDPILLDGLTSAASVDPIGFLTQVFQRQATPFTAADRTVIERISEHASRGPLSPELLARWLPTWLTTTEAAVPVIDAMLTGLAKGWPADHAIQLPDRLVAQLTPLLERLPPPAQAQLLQLASRWGTSVLDAQAERLSTTLIARLQDTQRDPADRLAAARQLMAVRPAASANVAAMVAAVGPQTDPAWSLELLQLAGQSRAADLGGLLLAPENQFTPALRRAVAKILLARSDTLPALLRSLEAGTVRRDELSLDQQNQLLTHPDQAVQTWAQRVLAAQGGLPDPDREKVLQGLLPLCQETGDAARGREVFKQHCAKCHRHGDLGESVGPNLTGMSVHPKAELLGHILDPSRSVEGNFRAYTVVLQDGRILNGMLASESKTALELVDTEGKRHPVTRTDIEQFVASQKSVMPEGFEKSLQRNDWIDLLEFLTFKGRFVPLDLRRAATISSARGMFYDENSTQEQLLFSDWNVQHWGEIPFLLIDPRGGEVANAIMLHSPQGKFPPRMPESVKVPVHSTAVRLHLLSGISGWGYPGHAAPTVSLVVRLHYEDGTTEDHPLKNGIHFADYVRRIDVPESEYAFDLQGRQIRLVRVVPRRPDGAIRELELVKGPDATAPIVMSITVERAVVAPTAP